MSIFKSAGTTASRYSPCGVGNNGKQWRYAVAALEAGGAAGHTAAVVEEAAGDNGLVEEGHESTRWGQAGDRVAGIAGAACLVGVLVVVEEGGWY